MDFISVWKAASIVMTGAFGILGLFTEFKHPQSKRVTRWGYIALAGIIISMVLGTIAQLKESQDSSAKALVIAKRSQDTLANIQRALYPLKSPRISASFTVNCDATKEMRRYCDTEFEKATYVRGEFKWPRELPEIVILDVDFFRKGHDPLPETHSLPFHGDWSLNTVVPIRFGPPNGTPQFGWSDGGKEGKFTIAGSAVSPDSIVSDGKLVSILDIAGSTVVLRAAPDLRYMKPQWVIVDLEDGQAIKCDGPFKPITIVHQEFAWQCSMPEVGDQGMSGSTGSSVIPDTGPS